MSVAETILQQLGGNHFIAMTGAKDFVFNNYSLHFRLPLVKTERGAVDCFWITIDPSDTYTVEAMHYDRKKLRVIRVCHEENVYCDKLQATFTAMTGLEMHL